MSLVDILLIALYWFFASVIFCFVMGSMCRVGREDQDDE